MKPQIFLVAMLWNGLVSTAVVLVFLSGSLMRACSLKYENEFQGVIDNYGIKSVMPVASIFCAAFIYWLIFDRSHACDGFGGKNKKYTYLFISGAMINLISSVAIGVIKVK